MRVLRTKIVLAAFSLVAGAAGIGWAQDTIPHEWAGIWQVETVQYSCGHPELPNTFSSTDTLCTGASLIDDGEIDFDCTGSFGAVSAAIECTGLVDQDGCTVLYEVVENITRNGDTFTGTGTITMTYGGTCADFGTFCMEVEITATRIAGEPASCGVQSEQTIPWGALKGLYR